MVVPSPWEFALGALAAWRIWKLLADDEILDRPRDWIEERSKFVETLLACPYCSGFWVAFVSTSVYYLVRDDPERWPVYVGATVTTFALSAAIVLIETAHDHLVLGKTKG